MFPRVPIIDLSAWRSEDLPGRVAIAAELDQGLRESGFLMVSGHGVPESWKEELRLSAGRFFRLPREVKDQYATSVGGRGWIPPGREANAYYGEQADGARPDLKESFSFGRELSTGDPDVDALWFPANAHPAEAPELAELCARYTAAVRGVFNQLMEISSLALGLPTDWFSLRTARSPHTLNINRYPPLSETGPAMEGQYRIAPHTDWGVLTILDRQAGYGGLQIQDREGSWHDAPVEGGAFTVNIGDLMARWTGDRWRSTSHRVLPPSTAAPDEELTSLIVFVQADVDTVVTPIPPPVGLTTEYAAVTAGDYLLERARAATVA
jgi:isopenicillin N synthase-like dioxygenase